MDKEELNKLKVDLEALAIRRDYSDDYDPTSKRNPLRQVRKRPLVVEISGIPKSGKSTCIEAAKKIFRSAGFNVRVIPEKADLCRLNKFQPMFNFWTFTSFVNELYEVLENNEDLDAECKYDIIICDRGAFDALVWFNWQKNKKCLTEQEFKTIRDLVFWDRIIGKIDQVILLNCSDTGALQREPAYSIMGDMKHSIMNKSVIKKLNKSINDVKSMFKKEGMCNIIEIESVFREEDKLKMGVVKAIVDRLKSHYDEKIAYFEKKDIHFELHQGVLSQEQVKTILSCPIKFDRRVDVEKCDEYLQPLPICILVDHGKILRIRKNPLAVERENGKAPELNKDLFYVGGHVRQEDNINNNVLEMLKKTLKRETTEEIGVPIVAQGMPFGVYATDLNKSKKHLGLYWIINIDSENAGIKIDGSELKRAKGTSKSGKFVKLKELDTNIQLETWSRLILKENFYKELNEEFISKCININVQVSWFS